MLTTSSATTSNCEQPPLTSALTHITTLTEMSPPQCRRRARLRQDSPMAFHLPSPRHHHRNVANARQPGQKNTHSECEATDVVFSYNILSQPVIGSIYGNVKWLLSGQRLKLCETSAMCFSFFKLFGICLFWERSGKLQCNVSLRHKKTSEVHKMSVWKFWLPFFECFDFNGLWHFWPKLFAKRLQESDTINIRGKHSLGEGWAKKPFCRLSGRYATKRSCTRFDNAFLNTRQTKTTQQDAGSLRKGPADFQFLTTNSLFYITVFLYLADSVAMTPPPSPILSFNDTHILFLWVHMEHVTAVEFTEWTTCFINTQNTFYAWEKECVSVRVCVRLR